MDADALPRRLAVAHLVLRTHLGLMVLVTLVPEVGKAVRLVAQQVGHVMGRGLTADAPDEFLLVLHLTAIFLLAVTLWLWGRGDGLTRRFMLATAIAMLPLAPLGLPIAALLFWIWRQPGFVDASEMMPEIAGNRRAAIVLAWIVATTVSTITAFGAFLLFGWNLLWLPAMLASPLPNGLVLWALMMRRQAPHQVPAMPRLPDTFQQYP